MDHIYDEIDNKPVNSRFSKNCTRRVHVVHLCLVLLSGLLLAGLVGISVHYHVSARGSAEDFSAVKANLTDQLTSLTKERDLLSAKLTEMTEELKRLQGSSGSGEFTCEKTCDPRWRGFGCTCYFVSSESGSWDKGRQDCKKRGADLVVINSPEEQAFFIGLIRYDVWIGLTDKDQEGTWKWVDGSPLTLKYWEKKQPDNGLGLPELGEEDCALHTPFNGRWNDVNCERSRKWICEKSA